MSSKTSPCECERSAISLILRVAVASLFVAAAVGKFTNGLDGVVQYFQATFKDTWLPTSMVTIHARITPFAELLIPIWLIVGYHLRIAWIFTGLFTVSLAFGMMVAGKYPIAANNYFYVLLICAGLYFSPYDKLSVDGMRCCKGACEAK